MWSGTLTKLAEEDECKLARLHAIRNFLANGIYHVLRLSQQTGTDLPRQPAPYNQILIQLLLLVPECCFAYNVQARVLKF